MIDASGKNCRTFSMQYLCSALWLEQQNGSVCGSPAALRGGSLRWERPSARHASGVHGAYFEAIHAVRGQASRLRCNRATESMGQE